MAPLITLYILAGCVAAAAVLFIVMIVISALRPPQLPEISMMPPRLERVIRAITPLPFATQAAGQPFAASMPRAMAAPAVPAPPAAPTVQAATAASHGQGQPRPTYNVQAIAARVAATPMRVAPPTNTPSRAAAAASASAAAAVPAAAAPAAIAAHAAVMTASHASSRAVAHASVATAAPAKRSATPTRSPAAASAASAFAATAPQLGTSHVASVARVASAAHVASMAPVAFAAPGASVAHVTSAAPVARGTRARSAPSRQRIDLDPAARATSWPVYPERRSRKLARFVMSLLVIGVLAAGATIAYPALLDPLCDDYEWFGADAAHVVRQHARAAHAVFAQFIENLQNL